MKRFLTTILPIIVAAVVAATVTVGCTENQRARSFGGSGTENLPANTKLVNVTWKGEQLWILTRPMKPDDVAETYDFTEKSSYGIIEGNFTINESKTQ